MNKISKTITYNPSSSINRINSGASGLERLRAEGIRYGVIEDLHRPTEKGNLGGVEHILLIFLIRGQMQIEVDQHILNLSEGQMISIKPESSRWLSLQSESARLMAIHLSPTEPWRRFLAQSATPKIATQIHCLESVVDQLITEDLELHSGSEPIYQHLSQLFVLYLNRELGNTDTLPTQRHRQTLLNLWSQVNARPNHNWSVHQLASHAHISPPHLHKICKSFFNLTPMQMVNRLRMEQAKTLLAETDATIDQVASRIGYASPYSFSDSFLKHSGVRPGKYRKQIGVS